MITQFRDRRTARGTLYRSALAASALGLTLGIATPVFAQEAAAPAPGAEEQAADQQATPPQQTEAVDEGGEEIVVTGIRRGIGDAIDIKRNETSIVEAISAEDIGKLPDVSIAESIARLPGLAAQRVNGRAQVISIRGLAPDFTTTLLNGRQQASSGDNRAVEFDQYPAELLSSVVVYKTPDAQIAGMGLSGTADLRTVRPLEFGQQAFAVNIRGEMTEGRQLNDDVRKWGSRISASYIDQFADGTLGIALGYARIDSPSSARRFKGYGYEAFGDQDTNGDGINDRNVVQPDSADSALFLNGQEAFATSRFNTRDAFIGILEWQPSDFVHITLDGYYSKFSQDEVTRGAQWFSNPFADQLTFTGVTVEERGGTPVAATGVANRVVPILRNDHNQRKDELVSIGLNNEFVMDDRTNFVADLSFSRNKRRETILETYAGRAVPGAVGGVTPATPDVGRVFDNIGFDAPDEGFPTYAPGLDYADGSQITLGDRAPWGGWGHDGAIRFPDVEEEVYALDLRVNHEMDGFLSGVDVGVNYTHRTKSKRVNDFDLFLKNGRQQVAVDPRFQVDATDLDFVGFGPVFSFDPLDALDTYYDITPILDANFYDKNWDIEEDVVTFFGKASIDWGNLRGNVGVQAVVQSQRSEGVVINGLTPGQPIVPQRIVDGDDYVDILPSLNLIYDLGGGHRLRFSASKTMARPRMDEMRANVSPGFNSLVCSGQTCAPGTVVNPWSASGGNPNLKPWRAKAVDAAYEWYIDQTTYVSIAGFYKWLDTYIYQQTGTFDFSGIPLPVTASSIPAGVIISPIGQITLPANGDGGWVRGLEFSGALNFGTITSALDGLGVLGSLSLTGSDLNPSADQTQEVRIPGLSGTVYNITGYFERDGFQARISQRYRSGFKGEVVQLFATRGFTEILPDRQVDAQIGYTIQSGTLEGLGVLLQVNNLTDAPYRTRLGLDGGGTRTEDGGSLIETYERYGRQFLLGFNYRF
ncbi:iron complex outermembrane receptor protein [Sphingomonas jejuensis]|uniref:Iron complex outermembrane receptor protein n=1 Tax=Sphingomonas jejuensis TaxID=904715 RepID=A0ABX0XI88_9SPHN|nr:TonB-dependent receptor [Sphingomonas jejuensis]NJC32940.1 iron complex outermembrane receptor protein [Sphingomonas jejuensis]